MSEKLIIFLVGLLVCGVTGDDFSCPSSKITINDGITGAIPSGANYMIKFDKGASCTFTFTVPPGYAIRMEASAYYDPPYDSLRFDFFNIPSGSENNIDWYMGPELHVSFYSASGNLTFFATYSYVDVSGFSQVLKKTGDYFNSTLEPNKYYTIQGSDTVTYNLGRRAGTTDDTIYEVFMFDGPDIVASEYIGRLSEFTRAIEFHSSSSSLTFLNLYRTPSNTVILGNDFSKIENLPQYQVVLMDPNSVRTGVFHNQKVRDNDAYYTFICDGCDHFYVEQLEFYNRSALAAPGDGYVEIGGMAPSQGLPAVLNYTWSPTTNLSLPQLIPSPIATFHSYKSNINFIMSTTAHLGYYNAADSKIRTVSSPTLWNPQADPNFDLTFSDPVKFFNFSLNFQTVNIVGDTDYLSVEVGSTDGTTSLQKKFQKGSVGGVKLAGVGNYLHLKYSGGKDSQVIVSFKELEMETTTTVLATLSTTVATTVTSTVPPTTSMTPTTTVTSTLAPTTQPSTTVPTTQSTTVATTAPTTVTSTVPPTTSTLPSTVTTTVPTTQSTIVSSKIVTTTIPTTVPTTSLPSTVATTTSAPTTQSTTVATTTTVPTTVTSTLAPSTLSTTVTQSTTVTSTPLPTTQATTSTVPSTTTRAPTTITSTSASSTFSITVTQSTTVPTTVTSTVPPTTLPSTVTTTVPSTQSTTVATTTTATVTTVTPTVPLTSTTQPISTTTSEATDLTLLITIFITVMYSLF